MSGVDIKAELDLRDVKDDIDKQVNDILWNVLSKDIPAILRQEKFPLKEDEYTLILRNRGKEAIRKLSTIRTSYLRLGSERSPLQFTFVEKSGNYEPVVAAAIIAYEDLIRRAPYDSGKFIENIGYFVSSGSSDIAITRSRMKVFEYKEGDTILITSPIEYARTIERGFYSKYYHRDMPQLQLPGGIFAWAAKRLRKRYGDKAAIRFRYTKLFGLIVPAIEIGPLGLFAAKDYRVVGNARRRR